MAAKIQEDLTQDELIELSLSRGEGEIASNGALLVKTGIDSTVIASATTSCKT